MDQRPFPGEPLPLDLLNTRWNAGDQLADAAGARAFSADHGVEVAPAGGDRARRALVEAREVVLAAVDGRIDDGAVERGRRVLRHGRLTLDAPDGAVTTGVEGDDPAWTVAVRAVLAAADLLGTQADRIRRCAHPACVLWFLDTSRGGARRWHDMATCGNRAKARAHYERSRDEGG